VVVVALHLDGWSVKAIASYMRVSRTTVYRVLGRWRSRRATRAWRTGRPEGPRACARWTSRRWTSSSRSQENPELGAFRIHAALVQKRGAEVSVRTVGRVMAVYRDLYGLSKPKRSPHKKAEMPFKAKRRHEIWTADVRYVPHSIPDIGNAYVIAILENYSRCILASAVSLTRDTTAFLCVLYSAIERYGPPERLVTDGGGIFKARQSRSVYRALGIEKEQIERRKPCQSYTRETTFGIQKRMADFHFAKAETFDDLARTHDTWREDYNAQRHWAHEKVGKTAATARKMS
jgi:putative transposase